MSSHFRENSRKKLLKDAFLAWKLFHLHRTVDWKRLRIRAEVRYAFNLKWRILKRWKLYVQERKIKTIRNSIARVFYERNVKFVYFLKLRYLAKRRRYRRKIESVSVIELVFCYCLLEASTSGYILVNSCLNRLASGFDSWKWRTERLRRYFGKLLNYANYSIVKKNLKMRVRLFLKSKYDPEVLRPYFRSWSGYAKNSGENRRNAALADYFFEYKLLRKSFEDLRRYKDYQLSKRKKLTLALQFCETKMKMRALNGWISAANRTILKANKIAMATLHYARKLKSITLMKIIGYKNNQQLKKERAKSADEAYARKLKRKSLENLRKYRQYRQLKAVRIRTAQGHFTWRTKRNHFEKIKGYHRHRKEKKRRQLTLETILEQKKNVRRLQSFFDQWKRLKIISRRKRELRFKAETFYVSTLASTTFIAWRQYVKAKITTRERNATIMTHLTFIRWKNFTTRQIDYRDKLKVAKGMYEKHLLAKGLSFFLKLGSAKQLVRKRKALRSFERDFELQSKYYEMWKRKALLYPGDVRESRKFRSLGFPRCDNENWNGNLYSQESTEKKTSFRLSRYDRNDISGNIDGTSQKSSGDKLGENRGGNIHGIFDLYSQAFEEKNDSFRGDVGHCKTPSSRGDSKNQGKNVEDGAFNLRFWDKAPLNSVSGLSSDNKEIFKWNGLCFRKPKVPDDLYLL